MDCFEIEGGRTLSGTVRASGSKNAALPILFASLLSEERVELGGVPQLQDIKTTLALLAGVGTRVQQGADRLVLENPKITSAEAPYDLVRTMRASVLILGPLLARERKIGRAHV